MYAVIDIETTGGSLKNGKITEIAIIIYDGQNVTDKFVSLVNPQCNIPQNISMLTGITNQMVAHAPKFYEIARQIVEITANKIFVAHNASFDYNFIRKEFSDLGYDFSMKKLCTVQLSRKYIPGYSSYSLGSICQNLGIDINGRHRAYGDAEATVKLLSIILKNYSSANKQLSLF
jgi:DNA polymerase-3 subunit epsilon